MKSVLMSRYHRHADLDPAGPQCAPWRPLHTQLTRRIPQDEETALPKLFVRFFPPCTLSRTMLIPYMYAQYAKLPEDIATRYCLLLDPMLGVLPLSHLPLSGPPNALPRTAATGGSAMQAIEVLLDHGVQEEKILFLNLVRCCVARWMNTRGER